VDWLPEIFVSHIKLWVLGQQFINDCLAGVNRSKVKGSDIFVAEGLLGDRSGVQLLSQLILGQNVMMQLVVAVIFELDAWSDQELDKVTVASSCNLSYLRSDSIIPIRLDITSQPEIGQREGLEKLHRKCPVDLPFSL
jgi:hypothetical protein